MCLLFTELVIPASWYVLRCVLHEEAPDCRWNTSRHLPCSRKPDRSQACRDSTHFVRVHFGWDLIELGCAHSDIRFTPTSRAWIPIAQTSGNWRIGFIRRVVGRITPTTVIAIIGTRRTDEGFRAVVESCDLFGKASTWIAPVVEQSCLGVLFRMLMKRLY